VSFGATAPMSCSREEPELSTAPDRAKSDSADVIVLGMGVGGEDVAERLARAGLDVIGIDGNLVGGECPYWGCVPSKMMIRAANLLTEGRRIPGLAGRSTVTADWAPVAQRIRDEATDNWDDTAAVERFEGKGGRFVRGWGRLDGPGRVIVDDRVLSARRAVVVNTGTKASVPPIDGLEGTPYWINRQAIESEAVPASLVVLGGGAVGAELGQVFARFGSAVSIIEEADRLLPPEEPEAGTVMAEVFGRDGIAVHLSTQATAVVHDGRRFAVETDRAGVVGGERLLVATGRHVDLAAIGAATIGVDEKARALPVDDHLRVCDGVWAIGDITGKGAFTHMAMYQADIVVRQILGEPVTPADYRAVPRVTFTDPEVGSVGLTEAAARAQGIDVRTGSAPVSKSARGWIHKAGNDGFIKLVEDAGRGCLVGATSCGPVGGEVLGLLTLAVHEAVPTEHLRHMIYAYPTFHRGILDAIAALAR
jgi:pyruvate/2-oxoglutarate dehydrogenase complex dihydrolipoamide dehydrogenase (E3) component